MRCWSCHGEQLVPEDDGHVQLASDYLEIFRAVFRNRTVGPLLLGGAIVAGVSAIPWVGFWLALALMGWAAGHYDRLFWSRHQDGESTPATALPRRLLVSFRHWIVGIATVLIWILPYLLRYADRALTGRRRPLNAAELAPLAVVCWIAVPLVLLLISARVNGGSAGSSRALAAARRHPLAILNALLLVPLGMILLELLLLVATWQQGRLPNLVLDLFPTPRGILPVPGNPFPTIDVTSLPDSRLLDFYGQGLRKGYTLTGAIPASLPLGIDTYESAANVAVDSRVYLALRLILATLIYWATASLLVIQARWLGRTCARRPLPQLHASSPADQVSQNGVQKTTVVLTRLLDRH